MAGAMAGNGSGLQWGTLRNLAIAWVLTLPVSILIANRPLLNSHKRVPLQGKARSHDSSVTFDSINALSAATDRSRSGFQVTT